MWVRFIQKELQRKRDSSEVPEIKALRLFNMRLTHDFNAKNDEATFALALTAVNYVGTHSPKNSRIILDKTI